VIKITPVQRPWIFDMTERLDARPPSGARFELPDDAASDAVERRRRPEEPKELAPFGAGSADAPTSAREVDDGAEEARLNGREGRARDDAATERRATADAGRPRDAAASAEARGAGDEPAIQTRPAVAEVEETPPRSRAIAAELPARLPDDEAASSRRDARVTQDATTQRTQAAHEALGEDAQVGAEKTAAPREAREARVPNESAKAARPEAARPDAAPSQETARASANAKAQSAPGASAQNLQQALQPQSAQAPPSAPASGAMNAELARLLALTSDAEDSLLPTARGRGDMSLTPVALGAELRGADASLQRVNPAPPAKDIAAQIAEAVARMAGDAEGDGVVRLEGAEVGRFLARIELSGRELLVRLTGHDAAAQAALMSRAPEVRAELERAGLVPGGVDVRAEADGGGERRDARPDGEAERGEIDGLTGTPPRARRRGGLRAGMDTTQGQGGAAGGRRVDLIA